MRGIFLAIVFVFSSLINYGQTVPLEKKDHPSSNDKPVIDSMAYNKWTFVDGAKITDDGKFMSYFIRNDIKFNDITILKECKGSWEIRIQGIRSIQFTGDSRMAFFVFNDTLCMIKLGHSYFEKIPFVKSVKVPSVKNGEWIAYGNASQKSVVLRNLKSGDTRPFDSVRNYFFSEDGKVLILESIERDSSGFSEALRVVQVMDGGIMRIWKGKGLSKLVLNSSATQLAFMLSDENGKGKSIMYYKKGALSPTFVVDVDSIGGDRSFVINSLSGLSKDGKYVFFTVKKIENIDVSRMTNSTVHVWSYLDEKLQSAQIVDGKETAEFLFAVSLVDKSIIQIGHENEWILNKSLDDNTFLVQHMSGDADSYEWKWNTAAQISYYVRSIQRNTNTLLRPKGVVTINLSDEGRFVVYYDSDSASYFSYEMSTGIYRNITAGLDVSWINSFKEDLIKTPRGILGWLERDSAILVYDKYDIWMIDPLGKNPSVNLTNGYGLKHGIIYYMGLSAFPGAAYTAKDTLILNALDIYSKKNGFFKKIIGSKGDPEKLTMGDCIYQLIDNPYVENNGVAPIKARNASKYIVMRMRAAESPNYFFTSDFRSFISQSAIRPEKSYNWYTTELHSWKKADGSSIQGVLYKPDNFNPGLKYPVIFYYYEKKSFALNAYLIPENISGCCNMNIPTFVSNGYLVFTPDIDYAIGDPMQGTYDAVVSAANYLSTLPFVDAQKMGIGGCSFGGIQTNYLVTHTSLFAAAYSSSSMSDMISAYGDVPGRYISLQNYFEAGQGRMGGTLWQKPEQYIKNSSIFNADKVTTPLLLMHTSDDGISSFSQAIELFTALRRLGKKVWLLEYTDANHGVLGEAAQDFSIRLSQFFDHYLKGKAAPKWMTKGVPAKNRGKEDPYKLDLNIKTPGNGLLIDLHR
ncbi:alpha/beta hydrolase family protein [Chitinophaga sp. RCC_12]|uniref:alpha/beta hydrolase family protein n=1 Tax=Chitinophaga sp. RCC_12 TaxID=3239226 RepID=UPI003525D3E9